MLQYFSSLLLEMYEAAEQAAWADFPALCCHLIDKEIAFDLAEFGYGFVQERRQSVRDAPVADPAVLSSSSHLALPAPIVCTMTQLLAFFDRDWLLGYVQRHDLRQLLLIGAAAQGQRPSRWLLLARRSRRAFSTGGAIYLAALWPHLLRCTQLCQQRYLAAAAAASAGGGFAVIGAHSLVEAADAEFERLAHLEWPGRATGQLPVAALSDLRRAGRHEGRVTRWSLERGPGDIRLCRVIERLPADLLTPAEAVAARHYALGRTHGEIAALLGVSRNTVRTHLAHVFSKLDIHRKSELPARLR